MGKQPRRKDVYQEWLNKAIINEMVELAGIEPASESKNKTTLAILLRSVVLVKS